MEFGKQLRLLRKEKNLTLRELEEQTGISYSALGKYERNERQPDFDTLEKLAGHFGVSIDWLLGRTDIRTYDELVFHDDVSHIAEKLTTLDPKKRKLIVDIIDPLYLVINSHIDDNDDRSLIIVKEIIHQLFLLNNGIEDYNFEKRLEIEDPAKAISFLSKHKSEFNNLLDEFFKLYLEKTVANKSKFKSTIEKDDELI